MGAKGQTNELRWDGRVAVITGGGRNLGRAYAHLLAARGARVLVNDLGVAISDTDGEGVAPEQDLASAVVQEILSAGGEAVANNDSVATEAGGQALLLRLSMRLVESTLLSIMPELSVKLRLRVMTTNA